MIPVAPDVPPVTLSPATAAPVCELYPIFVNILVSNRYRFTPSSASPDTSCASTYLILVKPI